MTTRFPAPFFFSKRLTRCLRLLPAMALLCASSSPAAVKTISSGNELRTLLAEAGSRPVALQLYLPGDEGLAGNAADLREVAKAFGDSALFLSIDLKEAGFMELYGPLIKARNLAAKGWAGPYTVISRNGIDAAVFEITPSAGELAAHIRRIAQADPFPAAIVQITALSQLEKVLAAAGTRPVLFDIFTDWCGWCKKMEPGLVRAASYHSGAAIVCRINAESNPEVLRKLALDYSKNEWDPGRIGFPFLVAIRSGRQIFAQGGYRSEEELREMLSGFAGM